MTVPTVSHASEYSRAKYKEGEDWKALENPIGTKKYDGAHFFMEIDANGHPRFISRRESVKGGYPDRTEKLPHLARLQAKELANEAYNVELIHTGFDKNNVESHPAVSGILNSLPEKAKTTQAITGPIRAVLLDVIKPYKLTYAEKIDHLKKVEKIFNNPELIYTPEYHKGVEAISKLHNDTIRNKEEGYIVTEENVPENSNFRIKIKHSNTYNLRIADIIQEVDIHGKPKESAGALLLVDGSGKIVGKVGTGLTRELRRLIWLNKPSYMNRLIQVKALPPTAHKLRSAVYNGDADGDIDTI